MDFRLQTYDELKSLFAVGGEIDVVKTLGACLHAEDQVAGREILWKLSLDADVPDQIVFYCEIYLGYMGDSRVAERLKSRVLNSESREYLGRTVALANLTDLEALRLLRHKLLDSIGEHEKDFLVFCATRNCHQFMGCETGPELVKVLEQLIDSQTPTLQGS